MKRKKPKFRVGQIVRLKDDYVSSFGWTIQANTICQIVRRGASWDSMIQFSISSLNEPFEVWVNDESLRPLTRRERGGR